MEAYSGLSQVRISAWSWQICDIQFVPVNVGFGSVATICEFYKPTFATGT